MVLIFIYFVCVDIGDGDMHPTVIGQPMGFCFLLLPGPNPGHQAWQKAGPKSDF